MNREIEFRAVPKDALKREKYKFIYGDLIKDEGDYFIGKNDCDEIGNVYYKQIQVIPETIGQYTGLKDKNGKKIFEGDIIRLDDEHRRMISAVNAKTEDELCRKDCLVGYKDGSFMFGRNRYFMNEFNSYLWLSNEHCEVIGTIFDKEFSNE